MRSSLLTLLIAGSAAAHSITVDGLVTDWSARLPPFSNMGIVARSSTSTGEYIFDDAANDQRTDLGLATDLDIRRFQMTADASAVSFLIRTQGAMIGTSQFQISIDTDQVSGSGMDFLAGFADTTVATAARWERLVQTNGSTAKVIDTTFNPVPGTVGIAVSPSGTEVEISVPWTMLGLGGPPATPLRVTVTSFRANGVGDTVDILGTPNAIDAVGDCGDPMTAGFPNAFGCDIGDGVINFAPDVWFSGAGEVISPVLIVSFTSNGTEFIGLFNQTTQAIPLAGYKLGDEETPDQGEKMAAFPGVATIAAGAYYFVANDHTSYVARFGLAPDAEFTNASAAVPDMTNFGAWATGTLNLANAGDEVVLLDVANTIIDIVPYGTSVFTGVTSLVAPGVEAAPLRSPRSRDTDDCPADFVNNGQSCATEATCGAAACNNCVANACEREAAGFSCTDGDACNGAETCNGTGACSAGTPLACDDSNACTLDACVSPAGCAFAPVLDGLTCADANLCNGAETCQTGNCAAGTPLTCGDGNVCTTDTCVPASGCAFPAVGNGTPCANGTVCDGDETCQGGSCAAGTPLDCDDLNPCTADSCDPSGGCSHTPVGPGVPCSNGNLCDGPETCSAAAVCTPGAPLDCADTNPCTLDTCSPTTGCANTNANNGTSCTDADACNGAETCQGGNCTAGTALNCNDGNSCTTDSCSAGSGCQNVAVGNGTACADSDLCNGAETCQGGTCSAGTALNCNDSNACTSDSCLAASGCANAPVGNGTPCLDADLCNGSESCQGGACTAGTALSCGDNNACTADTCSASSGCANAPVNNGTPCLDTDLCNGTETCQSGACTTGTALNCNDSNACTTDSCSMSGGCAHAPVTNGIACLDTDLCNGSESCQGGTCAAGTALNCDDNNACTVDSCSAGGGCAHAPATAGASCSDGNACNGAEVCSGTTCMAGTAPNCDDSDACTMDMCVNATGCTHLSLCTDGGTDGGSDAGTDAGTVTDAGSDAGTSTDAGDDAGSTSDAGEDAGTGGGAGGGSATGGGSSTGGGTGGGGGSQMVSGVCGCGATDLAPFLLAGLALIFRRRRIMRHRQVCVTSR